MNSCKECGNGPYDPKNECCFYCENRNFWLPKEEKKENEDDR